MKPVRYRLILLPLLAALLVLINSSRVFAYINQVSTDSLRMSTAVGTSTEGYVLVSDGQDTLLNLPKGTVDIYITGSSEFNLMTDSIVQFLGYTTVRIQYLPTSLTPSSATLVIVGDSNTLRVALVGTSFGHFQPQLWTGDYDSLTVNQQSCQNFGIENTTSDTIWIESVTLTQQGTAWSLDDLPSFPIPIMEQSRATLGQLCALWVLADSEQLYGGLTVVYTYEGVADSIGTTFVGEHRPVQTACITSSGGNFGAVAQGASDTQSILLINVTDSDVYLDSTQIAGEDASDFSINSPSFPLVLHSGDSVYVSITFTVPNNSTKEGYSAVFESALYGTSQDGLGCTTLGVSLTGSVALPVVDSITLDVPPGTNTLSFTAHTDLSEHAIFIQNDDTSKLLLQTLTIEDTTGVAFFGSYGTESVNLYDTLTAGATSGSILLTLQAPDTGTYNIELTLTYESQTTHRKTEITGNSSETYNVVAHRLPAITEGVTEPTPGVAGFSINPNPANGFVTFTLGDVREAKVEVFDLLGNSLASFDNSSSRTWDATGLPNGAYIARASGIDDNGLQFTISKRLIIAR